MADDSSILTEKLTLKFNRVAYVYDHELINETELWCSHGWKIKSIIPVSWKVSGLNEGSCVTRFAVLFERISYA